MISLYGVAQDYAGQPEEEKQDLFDAIPDDGFQERQMDMYSQEDIESRKQEQVVTAPQQTPKNINPYSGVPVDQEDPEIAREDAVRKVAVASMTGRPVKEVKGLAKSYEATFEQKYTTMDEIKAQKGFLGAKHEEQTLNSEANYELSQYMDSDVKDPEQLMRIMEKRSKANHAGQNFRTNIVTNDFLKENLGIVATSVSQFYTMMKDALPEAAAGAAAGGAAGLVTGPGAVATAGVGAGLGVGAAVTAYSYDQMRADLFLQLSGYAMANPDSGMTEDMIISTANKWAARQSVTEVGSIGNIIKKGTKAGLKVGANLLDVATAGAGEGATEVLQYGMAVAALHDLKLQMHELTTGEKLDYSLAEAMEGFKSEDALQSFKEGMLGGTAITGGMKGGTTAYSKFSDTSQKRKLEKQANDAKVAEAADEIVQEEARVKAEVAEVADKPIADVVDPDTGETIPGVGMMQEEIEAAKAATSTESGVTDSQIDDLVMTEDQEGIDAGLDSIIDQNESDITDAGLEFSDNLRQVLPEEQATAIESILTAHAGTFGLSMGQYVDQRSLELKRKSKGGKGASATTTFLNNGRALIKAFTGKADVSSIAHEIGHVFRKEIRGNEKAKLDEAMGLKPDAVWTVKDEEKFARMWEGYLKEGKAPTAELQGTFQKFTQWMTNIYKAMKNSPVDIPISPEVSAIFDGMLVAKDGAKRNINDLIAEQQVLEQRQNAESLMSFSPEEKAEAAAQAKKKKGRQDAVTNIVKEIDVDKLTDKDRFRAQMNVLRSTVRKELTKNNKQGVIDGKAQMKVLMNRRHNAAKTKKANRDLRKRVIKLADKNRYKDGKKYKTLDDATSASVTSFFKLVKSTKTDKDMKAAYQKYVIEPTPEVVKEPGYELMREYLEAGIDVNSKDAYKNMQAFRENLVGAIKDGRTNSPFLRNRIAANNMITEKGFEIVGQGVNVQEEMGRRTAQKAYEYNRKQLKWNTWEGGWKQRIATTTFGESVIGGWNGGWTAITAFAKSNGQESVFRKVFDLFNERQKASTEYRESVRDANNSFKDAYGIVEEDGVVASFKMNALRSEHLKNNIDVGFGTQDLFNKSMVRLAWIYHQDPTLNERMENNGFTPEVWAKVEANMDAADKKYATYLFDTMNGDAEYQRNSVVHKSLFGSEMVRRQKYFPISSISQDVYTKEAQENLEAMFDATEYNASAENVRYIKERTQSKNAKVVLTGGDTGMFSGYQQRMAHFRNFAPKLRLAKAVIENPRFKEMVTFQYGGDMYQQLKSNLESEATDGRANRDYIRWMDEIKSNYVSASIGLSVPTMMKQLFSTVQYADDMPFTELGVGIADFLKDPKANWKRLENTDFIKNRIPDEDLKEFTGSPEYKNLLRNPTIKNVLTMNIKYGDRMAVILGGHAYIKHLMKPEASGGRGMTRKQAENQWAKKSNESQQSSMLEERSSWARQGGIKGIITMYSSAQTQALRKIINAGRDVARGDITYQQAAKTIAIYQVIVPTMFSASATMLSPSFEWDKDKDKLLGEMALAAVFGPAGSLFTGGRMVTNEMKKALGMTYYQDSGPFQDLTGDMLRVAGKIATGNWEDLTVDDYAEFFQAMAIVNGYGAPIKRIERMAQGVVNGDPLAAITGSNPDTN